MQRNDHSCWPLLGRYDVSALGAGTVGVRDHSRTSVQIDPLDFVMGGGVVACGPNSQRQPLKNLLKAG